MQYYYLIFIFIVSLFLRKFHATDIGDSYTGKTINIPEQGFIQGSVDAQTAWTGKSIYQFLGIPYAESPSKQLRFKPPVERSKWDHILNVSDFGKICPTWGSYMPSPKVDYEDCLSLCVYTTNFSASRPVMVYIHGGGFYNGSSKKIRPDFLLEKDIVLVAPQYRLGVLGFLSTGTEDIPGNMAILDLIMALKWVQKYIKYFGGDSTCVTIFGQSAGAALVTGLMITPVVSKGLFHRAIAQSGSIMAAWAEEPDSLRVAQEICMKANCLYCTNAKQINECILSMDLKKLLYISTGKWLRITDKYRMISKDYNNVFPARPYELLQNSTKYPMITGVTKHDGTFLLAAVYDYLGEDFKKSGPQAVVDAILHNAGEEDPRGLLRNLLLKFIFKPQDVKNGDFYSMMPGLIDLSGIVAMKSSILNFAMLNVKDNPHPTYLYSFEYKGERTLFGYGIDTHHYPFDGGVHHSNDYLYTHAVQRLYTNEDVEMAENMIDLWTSFASEGIPKSEYSPTWKPLNNFAMGPYLHINRKSSLGDNFLNELILSRCKLKRCSNLYQLFALSVLLVVFNSS